jgi:hypothetical protein
MFLCYQGSQGLKAVTKAKLKYEPLELDPEDMLPYAQERPQVPSKNSKENLIILLLLLLKITIIIIAIYYYLRFSNIYILLLLLLILLLLLLTYLLTY